MTYELPEGVFDAEAYYLHEIEVANKRLEWAYRNLAAVTGMRQSRPQEQSPGGCEHDPRYGECTKCRLVIEDEEMIPNDDDVDEDRTY